MLDSQPSILVTLRPSLYAELFSAESDQTLRGLGAVDFHDQEQNFAPRR